MSGFSSHKKQSTMNIQRGEIFFSNFLDFFLFAFRNMILLMKDSPSYILINSNTSPPPKTQKQQNKTVAFFIEKNNSNGDMFRAKEPV